MSVRKIRGKQGVSVWLDIQCHGKRVKECCTPRQHPATTRAEIEAAVARAKVREAEIKASLLKGTYQAAGAIPTIHDALDEFEEYVKGQPRRTATKINHLYGLRNFRDFLQDRADLHINRVSDINPQVVVAFAQWLLKSRELGPGTANTIMRTLQKAVTRWRNAGYVTGNPFAHDDVKDARPKYRHRQRTITKDEYGAIHEHLEQSGDHDIADLWELARYTGMRVTEACSLRFCDVDAKESVVRVCSNGNFEAKTQRSTREIPLAPQDAHIFDMLKRRELTIKAAAMREGKLDTITPETRYFQFTKMDGFTPCRPGHLLARAVRALKIEKTASRDPNGGEYPETITFHTLRHTFATELYSNPMINPTVAAEIMGHSAVMAQTYAHPGRQDRRAAIQQVALARAASQ